MLHIYSALILFIEIKLGIAGVIISFVAIIASIILAVPTISSKIKVRELKNSVQNIEDNKIIYTHKEQEAKKIINYYGLTEQGAISLAKDTCEAPDLPCGKFANLRFSPFIPIKKPAL